VALHGSLRDFSATEILQLLGTQKKSGCLRLEWNTERMQVYVLDGRIVSTRPPGMVKDDPLLAFLRRIHRLSEEQYRGLLTIQRESNRDLEDLLLNGRYLDLEELTAYTERQILDDLMQLVRWENGTYRFDPNARWPNPPLVRLGMEGALIEAARRVDEQKRFVTCFKDPYQLLGVRDLPDPDEPLTEEERELFGIIDGQHTLAEVVEAAPLSEYEAYEALQRMVEANWVEMVGRRDPGTAAPSAPAPPSAAHPRATLARELLVASLVALTVLGLRLGGRALEPPREAAASGDVFAAAQMRNLRFALDHFHRERGVYPMRLEELAEDRWVTPEQLRMPGYTLLYRRARDGARYRLVLQPVN
jgi:hypothetical protein